VQNGVSTATTTTVSSSSGKSVFGQMVNLTATIGVLDPSMGTPTGTVQFQIDGINIGSPVSVTTLGGVTTASFSIAGLPVGNHTIAALYHGDAVFQVSGATL